MDKLKTMLGMLNIHELIDERVVDALKRLEQIDDLTHWYESASPLPTLGELATHQLKQSLEAAALDKMTKQEFEAFRKQWEQLTPEAQRRCLCDFANLPAPERDRDDDK